MYCGHDCRYPAYAKITGQVFSYGAHPCPGLHDRRHNLFRYAKTRQHKTVPSPALHVVQLRVRSHGQLGTGHAGEQVHEHIPQKEQLFAAPEALRVLFHIGQKLAQRGILKLPLSRSPVYLLIIHYGLHFLQRPIRPAVPVKDRHRYGTAVQIQDSKV